MNCQTIILWSNNGKLVATLFASRRDAFNIERVDDQMGMIAVKVTTTANFNPEQDYLVRQVEKNGSSEKQLVFGTLPKWAGGTLLAGRSIVADGSDVTALLQRHPATTVNDRETCRLNGLVVAGDFNYGKHECNCGKKACNCSEDECTGK